MVNIVKFAQFYCIYLLSSAQMSAVEKQIRCFYKKTIYSMAVMPSGIGILYTVRILDVLQAAGISRIISCFFEIISKKYRLPESFFPLHGSRQTPLRLLVTGPALKIKFSIYITITLERT